jgi:hypothetical protein
MNDTVSPDAARRWLADNLAWSRRLDELRDAHDRSGVLIAFAAPVAPERARERRRDRVA